MKPRPMPDIERALWAELTGNENAIRVLEQQNKTILTEIQKIGERRRREVLCVGISGSQI